MMLFSLVFVTFFDTTGTLMTLGRQCGFIDEEGQAVGIENAFLADAVGGIIGAIFGTSTVTAYVESATGIGLGGKTGLTAVITGILFILSIFFSPLVLALFTSPVTCSISIYDNYHDDFNILYFFRYCMGIRNLCSCNSRI